MRIIIDAMGGDNAPGEIVKGAVMAAREFDADIVLVGKEDVVRDCLKKEGAEGLGRISVQNAAEIIDMEDDPSTATRRKKDSSMAVALTMLKNDEGDAAISAGSTGALLTGATLTVKRIRGIRRAALAPVIPNMGKGTMLIDCGANVECTPEYMLQFAYMGSFYARKIMGCENPRVALLNVGVEDTKGTDLCKQTHALLTEAKNEGRLNFIGNAEARDIYSGEIDVLVTDGFSGNILLKAAEGTSWFYMKLLKKLFTQSAKNKLAAAMVKNDITALRKLMDAGEVGGVPMLGISKPVIKAHGSSDARAIRSAVRQAIAFKNADIVGEIEKNISYMKMTNE